MAQLGARLHGMQKVEGSTEPSLILDAPTSEVWSKGMHALGIDPAALVPGGAEEA